MAPAAGADLRRAHVTSSEDCVRMSRSRDLR